MVTALVLKKVFIKSSGLSFVIDTRGCIGPTYMYVGGDDAGKFISVLFLT